MEPELEGFPDIPKDFVGKVSMMREQVGKLLEILNETVAKIPAGMSTPESELLKGITHDLGVIAPDDLTRRKILVDNPAKLFGFPAP